MLGLRTSRCLLLAPAFLGGLIAMSPARADGGGLHLDEYVGIEAGPGWVNLASKPPFGSVPFNSWAPVATIRLARMETDVLCWTPAQFGLGMTRSYDYVAHTSTEIGKRFRFGGSGFVDLGLAAGVGILVVEYWRQLFSSRAKSSAAGGVKSASISRNSARADRCSGWRSTQKGKTRRSRTRRPGS